MHAGERNEKEETSSSSSKKNKSSGRHFVRQFALRQLEYMNQKAQPLIRTKQYPSGRKYTEAEARELVEKEAEEERRLLARNREGDENPFVPTLISKIKVDPNLLEVINKEEESYWMKNKETKASNAALGLDGKSGIVGRFSRGAMRKKREERDSPSSNTSSASTTSTTTTTTSTSKVDV